jgi:hypothetical protein
MGCLSKLIVVDNLGCHKCKRNSAEFLGKKNYPQIKRICWNLLRLIESYSRIITRYMYDKCMTCNLYDELALRGGHMIITLA